MSDKKRLLDKMERPSAKRIDPEDYETPEEYQAALKKANKDATYAVVGNQTYDMREKGIGQKFADFILEPPRQYQLEKWEEAKAEHRKQKNQPDYFVRTIGKK